MWKKTPLKSFVYASLGVNLTIVILILAMKTFLPPVVPLFYGLPSGPSQLGSTLMLLMIPGASIIVTFLNILVARLLKDDFYKKALVVSGTLISFLGAITVIKIIFLVGLF
jgi:hypothetical protein